MARALRLGAQGLALAGVAGLLVLLVWKVTHENRNTAASEVAHGKSGPAPAFSLPRLTGSGKVSLASLRGKGIVINFWASWCRPCKAEAPLLEQAWRKYRAQGLVVVGIDSNDVSSDARAFATRHGLTYTLLHDPGATYDRYGLSGVPETFFVDRRGRLVPVHLLGGVDLAANRDKWARGIRLALRS
jgi:cytochrome c biogenesis protein CcmG, thiol:disulfide interchange protein DsbE